MFGRKKKMQDYILKENSTSPYCLQSITVFILHKVYAWGNFNAGLQSKSKPKIFIGRFKRVAVM